MKNQIATLCAAFLTISAAHAQVISITTANSTSYTQNFDGLPSTGSIANAFSNTTASQTDINSLSGVTGMNGWYGTKNAGTGTANTSLAADNGSLNSGGVYSYGNATVDTSDRALGTVASGTNTMTFGAAFSNNSTQTITDLTLMFTAEFWRSSTSATNTLTFAYGIVDGTSVTLSNFLTTTNSTLFASLNVVGPAPVATNGPLDGNTNSTLVNSTITGLSIADGQTFFIRWSDFNDTGNDAGLAVDNLTLGAVVPEPGTCALLTLGLMSCLFLRKRTKSANSRA